MSNDGYGPDVFAHDDPYTPVEFIYRTNQVHKEAQRIKQKINSRQHNTSCNSQNPLSNPDIKQPKSNDPFNTDYKSNSAPVNYDHEGHTSAYNRTGLWGKQAGTGERLVLENSALARHPMTRFYGNVDRVKLVTSQDGVYTVSQELEAFAQEYTRDVSNEFKRQTEDIVKAALPAFENTSGHKSEYAVAFLSRDNIIMLIGVVQEALSFEFETRVLVEPDATFLSKLVDHMQRNMYMRGPLPDVLSKLNTLFLDSTVQEYVSILQRKALYGKVFLRDDRERSGRLPETEQAVFKRDIEEYDASLRQLSDPMKRYQQEYLKATGLGAGNALPGAATKNAQPHDQNFVIRRFK